MLKNYFLKHHLEEIQDILDDVDDSKLFSIYVDFTELIENDFESANKILHTPRIHLPECDASAVEAQEEIAKPEQRVKKKIRTRIRGVPENVDQAEIGELVSVTGIVVRISQPTVATTEKHLLCKKCQHITINRLEWERNKFLSIKECSACKKNTLHGEESITHRECVDYQEIKVQDKIQSERNDSGNMTVAFQVVLTEDLVDKCTSGDDVCISGYLIRKTLPLIENQRMLSSTFLLANDLQLRRKVVDSNFSQTELSKIFTEYWAGYDSNPLEGRNNILASICPQLYGMYFLKLAFAVVLAGGVAKTDQYGSRVRGDAHLLLCGDPGTGKSQMLRAGARLANRSVMTTGVGSTAAGLTAAAVKDSDGWHLEAGALVLANGGVCCIDELTTMSAHDTTSIHEAMEQQTISIAKAGLLSTLNCRCTIIAAINPIGGKFVDGEEVKMRLGGPLLSRFDVILFLKDRHHPEWDELVATHILDAAMGNDNSHSQKNTSKNNSEMESSPYFNDSEESKGFLNVDGLWSEKTLQEYFVHISSLKPKMTSNAQKILTRAFMYHRSRPDRHEERTTVRLMDSLVRLAEGHAKLMYRSKVLMIDAIFAVHLINLTNGIGKECSRFPTDTEISYTKEGAELLHELNLDNMIDLLANVKN